MAKIVTEGATDLVTKKISHGQMDVFLIYFIHLGCFWESASIRGSTIQNIKNVKNPIDCQVKCKEHYDCIAFEYVRYLSGTTKCTLSSTIDAVIYANPKTTSGLKDCAKEESFCINFAKNFAIVTK